MKEKLKTFIHAIILSGVFVLVIGLYFTVIKAGLPYQDPTTEMTINWMAYFAAGEVCIRYGRSILVLGLVGKIVHKLINGSRISEGIPLPLFPFPFLDNPRH
ncbi:MAG: hypothetical protein GX592_05650 [Clostridiales bacterium]|nr:hypothetical protein [Clostridiales bacterium]